ncbi:CBS domain protein [Heliophilum fasciatum]|uniref:CBS domain protein n=2 Tax=Heliophilum fasciatum TaxID=35700 RepID=A0A4R2RZ58_9FIRM|nr:CBS domain protein [Heliophilum fasciatum]
MESRERKASDIMTREVATVYSDATIAEVVKLLLEKRISGVPVISRQGAVLGVISEGDLLYKDKKLHYPSYITILDGVFFLESPKRFEEEFKKSIALKAEELMTRDALTVEEDATIAEMATLMTENKINRLPVVAHGKLVGIVTRADIIRAMTEDLL